MDHRRGVFAIDDSCAMVGSLGDPPVSQAAGMRKIGQRLPRRCPSLRANRRFFEEWVQVDPALVQCAGIPKGRRWLERTLAQPLTESYGDGANWSKVSEHYLIPANDLPNGCFLLRCRVSQNDWLLDDGPVIQEDSDRE